MERPVCESEPTVTEHAAARLPARAARSRSPAVGLLLGALLGVGGCATVAPYERETLARDDMQLSRSPDLTAAAQHATAYREGSSGAVGASGGGCGCN